MLRLAGLGLVALLACAATAPDGPPKLDTTGKTRTGEASYYADHFAGQTTASGEPFDPKAMTAASPTLPLGTEAKVTNKETGQTAHVTVNDRGPYAEDRILDVSPKVADKLGMKEDGTAEVKVEPTHVPKRDQPEAKDAAAPRAELDQKRKRTPPTK